MEETPAGSQKWVTPVRVNARGQVRPRVYNVFPDECPVPHKVSRISSGEILAEITYTGTPMQKENMSDVCDQSDTEEPVLATAESPEMCSAQEPQNIVFDDPEGFESQPIYPGHTMTIATSVILLMVYAMTHSITGSQLSDLLVLINLHCLKENPVFSSLQSFKKYFADLKSPLVKHFYCSYCLTSVNHIANVCPNTFCSKDLKIHGATSYFLEPPIQYRLTEMFQRKSFREDIKYRFRRQKKDSKAIEDIYDGELYQKLSTPGQPLSFSNNISFTWNTDGIPVFKSSKVSIWPMYLMINELPYRESIKKCNMIFYGLWFGSTKPSSNLFFGPLRKQLVELENNGILIDIGNDMITVKAF